MRILLATHFYPPGHLGGTEVLTRGLARALSAAGDSVEVVCAEEWEEAPGHRIRATAESVDGIAVHRLRFNWKKAPDVFRYLYDNPDVERWVLRHLARSRPDVVHATSCGTLSASVIAAARRHGVPIMLTATDFWFLCARNTLLQPDGALCSGPEAPWKCTQCLMADAKAYRWPRKLFPERTVASLLQAAARFPAVTNRPGFRGMLGDWQERQRYLGQALREVDLIVTTSQFLRTLLIRYGVPPERIRQSPYGLDSSQMGKVLSDIDVLVVPSAWYDFPLVIPSAFATKTPVVATNLPGMSEWVRHEVDGLLFERHDAVGLASSIRRLLDEPGLLDRLRSNIPPVKTLEEYASESVANYASLLKRCQEPASA